MGRSTGEQVRRRVAVPGFVTRHDSHFVYWRRINDKTVGITAILHVSMMQGDRLREAFGG